LSISAKILKITKRVDCYIGDFCKQSRKSGDEMPVTRANVFVSDISNLWLKPLTSGRGKLTTAFLHKIGDKPAQAGLVYLAAVATVR
jgi:hypothetical protein